MYRLLNAGVGSVRKLSDVSFSLNVGNKVKSTYLGHRCAVCARNQSTIFYPNIEPRNIRKKAKSKKNYYDLLVVTQTTAKQQKTRITKLTWADLQLLATTNLNLSELYKLKSLPTQHPIQEHTYSNLAVIEETNADNVFSEKKEESRTVTISDIPVNVGDQGEQVAPEVAMFETLPVEDSFHPETVEEPVENFIVPEVDAKDDLVKMGRQEVSDKVLASYFEVCSFLKNPNRGLNALIFHNHRAHRGKDKAFSLIKNVKVYNALLKGFAAKGDVTKMEEVLEMIRKDNVKLDEQSYIAILTGYGRANFDHHYLKEIRIILKEAHTRGFTFDKLMNKGKFLNDDREILLKTLRQCVPNYVPKYDKPVVQYDNNLVNDLNDPEQLISGEETFTKRVGDGLFSEESMAGSIKQQLSLEQEGCMVVKSIARRAKPSKDMLIYRNVLNNHFKHWEVTAAKAFTRDLNALKAQRSPLSYEPFMTCLPMKDFVSVIVDEAKEIAGGSETYSPTAQLLHKDLGNRVYSKYKVLHKQKTGVLDKVTIIHEKYCQKYANQHRTLDVHASNTDFLNPRQQWQWYEYSVTGTGATLKMDHQSWTPTILESIGKFLYRIIMHDLKVDVNAMRINSKNRNYLPAFYTIFRSQGKMVKEEVKPHPVLSRLLKAAMPETLTFPSNEVPMYCPPVPWTSIQNGGYIVAPCDIIRLPQHATTQKFRLRQSNLQQLYPSFDALNQLASVPWKVNTEVLDVILEVFNSGGSAKLDVPQPPSSLPQPPSPKPEMDKTQKFKLFQLKLQYRRQKAEMYSLWCDCLHRLSLANHYRNDVFWLPHNMDFRGRVYPIPPHLTHLGSDLARSLLIFAEGRPLGQSGLDWLKVHLINLTGWKKRDSVADRLAYANKIMDDILDSADNPLNGKKWWAQSEEPWQTLACCMEIAKAVRSEDPVNYRCHFPVHQDGSCNGLQHYAALGRDSAGAYSVNLCPSQVPQDVYSAVVFLVEKQRYNDAANGVEVAKALSGFIKRKVIKQTIMTTVYGVTKFGARLQIAKQLKDIDDFPKDLVWAASSYLTARTFDSLRSMFTTTREIQEWLTDCARLISSSGHHVEWITPLGLPIVQPYIKYKSLGSSVVYKPFHMDQFEKPNVMKQKNAFAPNFIHSLDSCHMMLTSLNCERAGVTFVSVHDCYWTHPSTVPLMNKICREQFVALHSLPILENLSQFFKDKYSDDNAIAEKEHQMEEGRKKLSTMIERLPKTGDFDINQVLNSTYFFS